MRPAVTTSTGASTPEDAVAAVKVVEHDVAAICLNMGCPKEFSVKNGMGAALLKTPELAADIIRAIKAAIPTPVVAKIRMLSTPELTIELMRTLETAGADAITVHMRYVTQRSSEAAHRAYMRHLVAAVSIPVLGNGDVVDFADAERWRRESGCAGCMVGRNAAENPSCFRRAGLLPPTEMLKAHLDLGIEYEEVYQNMKYFCNHFFSSVLIPGSAIFVQITQAKTRREIAALFEREAYYDKLESERGRGAALESAGWWKGNPNHTEHLGYVSWLRDSADINSGTGGVGSKRERSFEQGGGGGRGEGPSACRAGGACKVGANGGGGGADSKVFRCETCTQLFLSRNSLFKHMQSSGHK